MPAISGGGAGARGGAATQADVETWPHGATRYRYLLRDLLNWASARRLAGNITVPALPPSELNRLISGLSLRLPDVTSRST